MQCWRLSRETLYSYQRKLLLHCIRLLLDLIWNRQILSGFHSLIGWEVQMRASKLVITLKHFRHKQRL